LVCKGFHRVDVHKHVISFLHFDGEESPLKEQLVANFLGIMHTTKSLPHTFHIVSILNVCKLGIHGMFTKQCKILHLFLIVICPYNFITWQGGTPINKFSKPMFRTHYVHLTIKDVNIIHPFL
jgi:hypothetical protein